MTLRKEILDESEGEDGSGEEVDDEEESEAEGEAADKETIIDKTETNLVCIEP